MPPPVEPYFELIIPGYSFGGVQGQELRLPLRQDDALYLHAVLSNGIRRMGWEA